MNNPKGEDKTDNQACDHTQAINLDTSRTIAPTAASSQVLAMMPHMEPQNNGLRSLCVNTPSPTGGQVIRPVSGTQHFTTKETFNVTSAKIHLKELKENNFDKYVILIATVINSTHKAKTRKSAGLQLKQSLTAKNPEEKAEKYNRWLNLPEEVRNTVKMSLLNAMNGVDGNSMYLADSLSTITVIEISNGKSQDIIGILTKAAVNGLEPKRESSMDTIGFICQDIEAEVLFSFTSDILEAITHGVIKDTSELVKFSARKAMMNSIVFFQRNLQKLQKRYISKFLKDVAEYSGTEDYFNILLLSECVNMIKHSSGTDYPDLKDKEETTDDSLNTTDAPIILLEEDERKCETSVEKKKFGQSKQKPPNDPRHKPSAVAQQSAFTGLDHLFAAANFLEKTTPKSEDNSSHATNCHNIELQDAQSSLVLQEQQQKIQLETEKQMKAGTPFDKGNNEHCFKCQKYGYLFTVIEEWLTHLKKNPNHTVIVFIY